MSLTGQVARLLFGPLLLIAAINDSLLAAEVTVTARYRGQSNGQFENTTPPAGYCTEWPWACRDSWSVALPLSYSKQVSHGAADVRDRHYLQTPTARPVDVFHDGTGEHFQMRFEVVAVGYGHRAARESEHPVAGWVRGGCTWLEGWNFEEAGPIEGFDLLGITNPAAPSPCYRDPYAGEQGKRQDVDIYNLGISYRLYMPSPTRIRQGLYRGRLQLRIGAGGDFDFGNQVSNLSSDTLTINFELDVQHQFDLWFPPGSERAVLEPPGGWVGWLGGRGAPQRLYRDLPFHLWSTGPFKVYARCQLDVAGQCGMRNPAGHQVPVNIALTLPAGVEYQGGAVNRLPVPVGRHAALLFDQVTVVSNRPGQMHFDVSGEPLRQMLQQAGSKYEGEVTVVFDAEL